MAYLIDEQKLEKVYLKSYHTVGRQKLSVDTIIDKPTISRHHAIIELADGKWQIRDVSTNGVWLNDKKLDKNLSYTLAVNDKIDFAVAGENSYVVGDLDTNCRYLISQSIPRQVIEVTDQHVIPNDDEPSFIIYHDKIINYWFIEDLNTNDRQALFDGGIVKALGTQWQYICATEHQSTEIMNNEHNIAPCSLMFNVSQDEENTQLSINVDNKEYDLGTRSHHYLLLLLARHRIEDKENGVELSHQGWQYREHMAKDLGIQMNHMNIMLHRARKQLSDLAEQGAPDLSFLLETYFGKIRLNCQDLSIIKGAHLETRVTF
ncbi:FHA domain-containing protein [Pseudoalteromonas xiamenensis]|uniref:FHA domain-containing protein n=1 Tax=Pseudoalteromonas xiamenensis TaxID=882626 RepID=A0A975HKV7_9GAMM|nr:FHA domain-containing protein [Pseudoalteromonas xiamenensis]QTH70108.1 FHA domain-containing protein [Pseudoalteromonas xiamenensis]QTH71438.1 FHA domain-containing protein [Pseudoalteromonas xiamenensis]